MGLKSNVTSIILTAMFAFCIIGFSLQWLILQNPSSDALVGNYSFMNNSEKMNATVQNFRDLANFANTNLTNSAPDPFKFVFLIGRVLWDVPIAFLSALSSGIVSIGTVLYSAAGLGGIVFVFALGGFLAILVIKLVLDVIETIRTGSSR